MMNYFPLEKFELFRYVKPFWLSLLAGLILLSVSSTVFVLFPFLAGDMAEAAIGGKDRYFDIELHQYGPVFFGVIFLQGLVGYMMKMVFAKVGEKATANLRIDLYRNILGQSLSFFERESTDELSSRIVSDVNQVQDLFSISLADFIRSLLMLIGGSIAVVFVSAKLSFMMFMVIPIIAAASIILAGFTEQLTVIARSKIASSQIHIGQTFRNITTVKAFGAEDREVGGFKIIVNDLVAIWLRLERVEGLMNVFTSTVLFGGFFFVVWQGAIMVQSGQMVIGDLLGFILFMGIITSSIQSIGSLYSEFINGIGATERIRFLLNKEVESSNYGNLESKGFSGYEFEGAYFKYPDTETYVLNRFDFKVRPGQKIAIVGGSGSGKSTVLKLLMNLYLDSGGTWERNGRYVRGFDLKSMRESVGYVEQKPKFFNDTIWNNLTYGDPDASLEWVRNCCDVAGCLDIIDSCLDGFGSKLGEDGVLFSGGELQRFAIARALIPKPELLLLDEATSALDAITEQMLQDNIFRYVKSAIVIVAHRLSTVRNSDLIYVMDRGKVIESGNHYKLMNIEKGKYRELVNLQFQTDL